MKLKGNVLRAVVWPPMTYWTKTVPVRKNEPKVD